MLCLYSLSSRLPELAPDRTPLYANEAGFDVAAWKLVIHPVGAHFQVVK